MTVADLRLALAEGFVDIEHVKRYTTLGIGTEQGATSAVLGAAILAELKGEALDTSRHLPLAHAFRPVTLNSLAGLRIGRPFASRGAPRSTTGTRPTAPCSKSSGLWMRPRYYRVERRRRFCGRRGRGGPGARLAAESPMARRSARSRFAGPDAAGFLDTMYLTKASTIKVGRCKYMVNLREDGMVLDDGLVLRLAPDRFPRR